MSRCSFQETAGRHAPDGSVKLRAPSGSKVTRCRTCRWIYGMRCYPPGTTKHGTYTDPRDVACRLHEEDLVTTQKGGAA